MLFKGGHLITNQEETRFCEHLDAIDNSAFDVATALADEELDWDMSMIAEIIDSVKSILKSRSIHVCHPFLDDNETVCYNSQQRCAHCHIQPSA